MARTSVGLARIALRNVSIANATFPMPSSASPTATSPLDGKAPTDRIFVCGAGAAQDATVKNNPKTNLSPVRMVSPREALE
jgi:hypothetical protein